MAPIRNRKERSDTVAKCLTCMLCSNFLTDATKLTVCFHTFCKKCIYDELIGKELNNCPVCNAFLGQNPLEKLRSDYTLQSIRNTIIPEGREKEGKELLPAILHPTTEEAIKKLKTLQGGSSSSHNLSTENAEQKSLMEESRKDKEVVTTDYNPKYEAVYETKSIMPQAIFYEEFKEPLSKPIQFILIASHENQEAGDAPLPQIAYRYVATRDGNVSVSCFQRYIAEKLCLANPLQVEILCLGQPVPSRMETAELIELWRNRAELGLKPPANAERPEEEDDLMVLHYRRRKLSPLDHGSSSSA